MFQYRRGKRGLWTATFESLVDAYLRIGGHDVDKARARMVRGEVVEVVDGKRTLSFRYTDQEAQR